MIVPTLARIRQVAPAKVVRKTILSHIACAMLSERTKSKPAPANTPDSALREVAGPSTKAPTVIPCIVFRWRMPPSSARVAEIKATPPNTR